MNIRFLAALALAGAIPALQAGHAIFDPCQFGAQPDGKTLCTEAIQQAIDACAAAGGGTVTLAGGQFLSGTVFLRSHVTLNVESGATLLGSTDIAHYPHNVPAIRSYTDTYVKQSLIAGENLEDVGITGHGIIDGQGEAFKVVKPDPPYEERPYLIRLVNCRDVRVEGVRLQKSAMWMQHYLGCERLLLRGIRVWNFGNANNDSLDLDGCKDCTVSQCVFESDDDAITLKSTFERPCESITISDCIARSHCNAIKMGTESNGGFKNVTITNCAVSSPTHTGVYYGRPRGMGGVSLELVDGGQLERVAVSNISIEGVMVPLFLRLGARNRPYKDGMDPLPIGCFRNVVIQNIVATGASKTGCSITGLPEARIENVSLNNIQIEFEGGGTRDLADRQIEEHPQKYPEGLMFGDLPAYGFYCRHVRGLRFSNLQLRTAAPDLRHAVVCDDVENLSLDGLDAQFSVGGAPPAGLIQVRNALIRGSQPLSKGVPFLELSGSQTRNIALLGNDLRGAAAPAETAPDVPAGVLYVQ